MDSSDLTPKIISWLNSMQSTNKLKTNWTSGSDMYKFFCAFYSLGNTTTLTYQSFIKKLNLIESDILYLYKCIHRDKSRNRIYLYFISNTIRFPPQIRRITKPNFKFNPQSTTSRLSENDTLSQIITPKDNGLNDNNHVNCHTSEISLINQQVLPYTSRHLPQTNTDHVKNDTTNTQFSILCKYGIPTDLSNIDNLSIMQSLLQDIKRIGKNYPLLYFRQNSTVAKPFFIPSGLSSKKSFDQWEKRGKGFDSMLEFISNGKINEDTSDPISVDFLLEHIYQSYPKTFHKIAISNGLNRYTRMSTVETAALLSDLGIGDKRVLTTIQQHIKLKFNGKEIFCPKCDLKKLTHRLPKLKCFNTNFQKEVGIKKENIGVSCIDTIEAIKLDMDRFIESKFMLLNIFDLDQSCLPLFNTKTPTDNLGTYVLVGTDHGKGTTQFQLRILFGPSSCRRSHHRPDYNTRTITYATIKCKKDPYEILSMTKEETNSFIKHLRTHKLIALTDGLGTVRCIFVHVEYTSFAIVDNMFIASGNGVEKTYEIPSFTDGTIHYCVLVNSFHILQIGDLLAQMTLQGREGMASCRCIKCNLKQSEWKLGINHSLINKEDLTQTLPNISIGQKHPILWDISPIDTVVPILHCQLGTVNDQLFKKLFRQMLCLDVGSEEELIKRTSLLDMRDELIQLEETKLNLATDLIMIKHHWVEKRADLTRKKTNITNRLKNAKRGLSRVTNNELISSLNARLLTITDEIRSKDKDIVSQKKDIESLSKQIDIDTKFFFKTESDIKNMQWMKRTQEVSIHTKVERILESHGVTIQAYHGGSLTGGSIITLLEKHQVIMDEITQLCHEHISNPDRTITNIDDTITLESIDKILSDHRILFQAQDAVYAHLRLIDPTETEMLETVEQISIMKQLWLAMGLSETPKAHLIFSHAADDQRRYGGLGDKIEDPLEKRHQEQMRLDNILKKMTCGFEKKMLTQLKYDWRNTDPLVTDQIRFVKTSSSRKRGINLLSLADERSQVLTVERID